MNTDTGEMQSRRQAGTRQTGGEVGAGWGPGLGGRSRQRTLGVLGQRSVVSMEAQTSTGPQLLAGHQHSPSPRRPEHPLPAPL